MKVVFILFIFLGLSPLFCSEKPNIIVIYTDDQGFGDVSAFNPNAKFQTPNMDLLAKEGVSFTHGHSASSVCTPSRYGLLTGRYPWRTRMKVGVMGADVKCLIPDDRLTIASMLKAEGYHTAMVGKWHLGMDMPGTRKHRDWSQPIKDMPLDKGFDYFFGVPASLNFGVLAWFEGRYAKVPPTLLTSKKKNDRQVYRIMPPYYETEERVAQDTHINLTKRCFEVAPDFIDNQCLTRFTDKAIDWMKTKVQDAKKGKPFFLYLPYTSPHYPVCPLPRFRGQGECGAYGELVIETDEHIGRILSFLKEQNIDKNTLIVFTSDNGPERLWESRIPTYGHDSKAGFREGKTSVYEGGHRVPFIVRWPEGIKQAGRKWDAAVGQIDLLATFADIIGVKIEDNQAEDSQSFLPVLQNKTYERLPLITRADLSKDDRYAITEGDWKLIMQSPTKGLELYNLKDDPAESKNVVKEHAQLAKELTQKISKIVLSGRTTAGKAQKNDSGYWSDLRWMTKAEFEEKHGK